MPVRIDKYLWAVRIFKTRSIAAQACDLEKVKIKGQWVKASRNVNEGDTITIRFGPFEREFKVVAPVANRQPAKNVPDFCLDITPAEVIEKMKAHVKTQYLARYNDEWSADETENVADTVAKGAIKYGMLRQDTNKKIVFDMDEWLKLDGESGPFIQYSYARINSLLKKFGQKGTDFNGQLLAHPSEVRLMQHLMNFNGVVVASAENYKPAALCTYLYETAKKFNAFYHDCPIGNVEDPEMRKARLALSAAVGLVLVNGLSLLGIPVPERM